MASESSRSRFEPRAKAGPRVRAGVKTRHCNVCAPLSLANNVRVSSIPCLCCGPHRRRVHAGSVCTGPVRVLVGSQEGDTGRPTPVQVRLRESIIGPFYNEFIEKAQKGKLRESKGG